MWYQRKEHFFFAAEIIYQTINISFVKTVTPGFTYNNQLQPI